MLVSLFAPLDSTSSSGYTLLIRLLTAATKVCMKLWAYLPALLHRTVAVSYAGGVAGGSIIVVGGEVHLEKSRAEPGQHDDEMDEENRGTERRNNLRDFRVEGELYDEETERWYSLPQAQSGLGPGRTHAATTSCRVLSFATIENTVPDGDLGSSQSTISTQRLSTAALADGAGSQLERAGAVVRKGGLVTSMTESIDRVRIDNTRAATIIALRQEQHCELGWLLSDAMLCVFVRRSMTSEATAHRRLCNSTAKLH